MAAPAMVTIALEHDLTGSNAELAASHNRRVILEAIHRHAPISRTELARRSGLTKQAVARIAERLMAEGLIVEARRRRGQRGQPAIELEIDPVGCFGIGVSVDRDYVTALAVDAAGRVCGRRHHETPYVLPETFVELVADAVREFQADGAIDPDRVMGIGLAVPDWLGEMPFPGMPASYAAWTGFDLRGRIGALTGLRVYIDNDATAAAVGELNYGLGRVSRSFFQVNIGAGLGGGLVLDGHCHRGTTGLGGEIGWLPVVDTSAPEGSRVKPLGELVSLFVLYRCLGRHGLAVSEPHQLLALDERGRALVSQWLRGAAAYLAEAAVDIGLLVNPDAVVLGGRLPVPLIEELLATTRNLLAASRRPAVALHRAARSEDASAFGAATIPIAHRLMLESADPQQLLRLPLAGMPARYGSALP